MSDDITDRLGRFQSGSTITIAATKMKNPRTFTVNDQRNELMPDGEIYTRVYLDGPGDPSGRYIAMPESHRDEPGPLLLYQYQNEEWDRKDGWPTEESKGRITSVRRTVADP